MDISDMQLRPVYQPSPPHRRVPVWVWVVVGLAGGFATLIVVGIVTAIVIPLVLNARGAVSASGKPVCEALSAQDRRNLLGTDTGEAKSERSRSGRPGGCLWSASGSGGGIELIAVSPQDFREVIAVAADTARRVAPAGSPAVARLDALSTSTERSCALYAEFARVAGQADADPMVLVAAMPATPGATGISAYTCRDDEVVGLAVYADDLDVSAESQAKVSAMLTLVAQRLD